MNNDNSNNSNITRKKTDYTIFKYISKLCIKLYVSKARCGSNLLLEHFQMVDEPSKFCKFQEISKPSSPIHSHFGKLSKQSNEKRAILEGRISVSRLDPL